MRDWIAAAMAGLCLAGCAWQAAATEQKPSTAGQALAQAACPHRILEANAWINYMPGPNRAPRLLNIDVQLADSTDTAILLRSAATTGDVLVLEIRSTPAAPIPGRLAYREPVPDPLYKRISFFCRGGEIQTLDHVERVY